MQAKVIHASVQIQSKIKIFIRKDNIFAKYITAN